MNQANPLFSPAHAQDMALISEKMTCSNVEATLGKQSNTFHSIRAPDSDAEDEIQVLNAMEPHRLTSTSSDLPSYSFTQIKHNNSIVPSYPKPENSGSNINVQERNTDVLQTELNDELRRSKRNAPKQVHTTDTIGEW